MFTGIIEELGKVQRLVKSGINFRLEVYAPKIAPEVRLGESVSVNGVCLTSVEENKKGLLCFDLMPKSFQETNFKEIRTGDKVNLERALKADSRLSGHFVSGHVDCTGVLRRRQIEKGNLSLLISYPVKFSKYLLAQGSITVDGISLTVAKKQADTFSVYIIPHTLKNTTLDSAQAGDKVNLEFDMLVKACCQS